MKDVLSKLLADRQEPLNEEDYPECPFLREHSPLLHDLCRFDRYEGKSRSPCKLTVSTDNGLWVVSLTDPDPQRSFGCTGPDFVGGLESLEQMITTGQAHWRYWGKRNGKTRR